MSGHSKWATTKRAKAVVDAKRGSIFTKMANLIIQAAKKGGDPESNFVLKTAVERARAANMPKDNIERAIKRGTGELAGATIEELVYEGIGPAQSQFIVKCLTDSRNRSAATVRHAFDKVGGGLSSVMWNFHILGVLLITNEQLPPAKLADLELELIDLGAEDIINEEEGITIYCKTNDLQNIKKFLEAKGVVVESAEMEYVAKEKKTLTGDDLEKFEKFIDILDENEDVSDYYSNVS
jgi:YebC/PmpR family DNA-binding regulatory protein